MKHYTFYPFLLFLLFFSSCQKVHFNPLSNFPEQDTISIDMDLENAILEGIVIPSARQVKEGCFVFSFDFKGNKKKKYFYKIYYQNESYKFDESDSLAYENFYGSWEDVTIGFKPLPIQGNCVDSFRIVGNPRNETIFYGADLSTPPFSPQNVEQLIEEIKNNKEWYQYLIQKSKNRSIPLERLLHLDALWVLKERQNEGVSNHRWKRNPRTGNYSFMLVICDEENLPKIPHYIQYIGEKNTDGNFVNPYQWFKENKKRGIVIEKSKKTLKTRAVLTPQQGIYVDEFTMKTDHYEMYPSDGCGTDTLLYKNALFQQFFSSVSEQYTLRNIPLIHDVISDVNPYTIDKYNYFASFYDSAQLKYDYPAVSHCPCKTVQLPPERDYIRVINPGNKDENNLKKESTGIQSRIGFTYGKFRGKIKFPVMLNEENIWNGLTYAFWLIYQDHHPWNNRRFSPKGYIDKGDDSEHPIFHPYHYYSEIDIEIVKTSPYWTEEYYWNKENPKPTYRDETKNNDVMFCCTNWDLASPDPVHFSAGINKIPYQKKIYDALRWYDYYKALTIKTPISNDIFKEEYYYYEIEWKPNEIIWRIGATPQQMKVVGYISDKYSAIPNNQMLCIITQEYHYAEWWPPIVYQQGLIPYPKNDIEGRVYEIVIE